ncbi:MAG TPA: hypothetical protein VFB89_10535 [Gemmatimonadales bacterium]|nr:hypothetical protein [Gemmatimonadales bacterium]
MKTEIGRAALKGAKVGLLAGLCLSAPYLAIGALGDTELNKSLGYSLLLVGFPTLFAIVPAIEWLGVQGGTREGVLLLLLTLSLNGVLWGTVVGTVVTLASMGRRKWLRDARPLCRRGNAGPS